MNPWETAAAAALDAFLEDLAQAGFAVRSSEKAEGDIDNHGRPVPVDITIPAGFPYEPPKVRPIDGTGGLSWHANLDGSLCLWALAETGSLPWRTANQVVQRVREWLDRDADGWKGDTPDLDLERYWPAKSGWSCIRTSTVSSARSRVSRGPARRGGSRPDPQPKAVSSPVASSSTSVSFRGRCAASSR